MILRYSCLGTGFLWDIVDRIMEWIQLNFWSLVISFVLIVIMAIVIICFLKRKGIELSRIIRVEFPKTIEYKGVRLYINKRNKKLAYNIWVELATRKIAIDFDEENDTIVNLYKSWYMAFGLIREYIKELGPNTEDQDLRNTSMDILNKALRPHLTKYHSRFENWFNSNYTPDKDPQEFQKLYPQYEDLVDGIIQVNKACKEYIVVLEKIIGTKLSD